MNCSRYRDWVAADVDGAPGARAPGLEAHLAQCPGCRTERTRQIAVRDLLRARAVLPQAPPGLRTRVRALLEAETGEAAKRRRGWRKPLLWAGLTFAAAAAATLAVLARGTDFDPLIREYDRAVQGALEIDFRTDAPAALEEFYRRHAADRVPAHVVDLSAAGFRLVGGALIDFPGRRARLSLYSDGRDLIVCDYRFAAQLPMDLRSDGRPVFFRRGGASLSVHRMGGEVCVLVTRMSMDDFRRRLGGDSTAG
ncbi:MAG: hypothetical protein HYY35_09690 [Deltaproteobacteria bacterium]|nr:hypothetical protein [Deltaproteobacteria bacterium]